MRNRIEADVQSYFKNEKINKLRIIQWLIHCEEYAEIYSKTDCPKVRHLKFDLVDEKGETVAERLTNFTGTLVSNFERETRMSFFVENIISNDKIDIKWTPNFPHINQNFLKSTELSVKPYATGRVISSTYIPDCILKWYGLTHRKNLFNIHLEEIPYEILNRSEHKHNIHHFFINGKNKSTAYTDLYNFCRICNFDLRLVIDFLQALFKI